MALDAKRRVVLVRRDNKEHLLLLGGATEMVIEGEIQVDPERDNSEEPSNAPASFDAVNLIDGIRHGLGGKK